eukprot:15448784-Alexandrium_andersonii.AAC.1
MSASLVGSEMCIRDSFRHLPIPFTSWSSEGPPKPRSAQIELVARSEGQGELHFASELCAGKGLEACLRLLSLGGDGGEGGTGHALFKTCFLALPSQLALPACSHHDWGQAK